MKYSVFLLSVLLILSGFFTTCSNNTPTTALRIITEEFPPFNFTDQDGNITGQSSEIVREILRKTGTQASIEMMPWSQGYELVQKEPNTLLYSTSRIPERENLFKWVGPIGTEDNYFYVRQDSNINITTLEQAKAVSSIAVYRNDSNHIYLEGQGFTNLDINENDGECLKKLLSGEVDVWLGPSKALHFIAYKAQVNPAMVKPIMYVRPIQWYIAFNKMVSDSIVDLWLSKLEEIKEKEADGRSLYERITTSYEIPQYVDKSASKESVIQLVEKTAEDISKDTSGTFRKINKREHPYRDRDNSDLYVFVYDTGLNSMANADNPSIVGRNFKGVSDIMGKLFRDRILERSVTEGSGWEDYVFTLTGRIGIFQKSAYFKLVAGRDGKQYIVCSGRYLDKATDML
ncbi:transporter substrate-binding domain-containing protein [Chloroflexota bacterium]